VVALVSVAAVAGAMLVAMGGTAQALSNPAFPQLTFDHTITSRPFTGAPGNAIDIEGLGYVPADNSMWVADDNGDRVWEIDPTTGAYKSQLRGGNPSKNAANIDFTTATNVTTGLTCGQSIDPTIKNGPDPTGVAIDTADYECLSRTDDFESVIYDSTADVMYVTSGNCCNAGLPPNDSTHPEISQVWVNGVQQSHYPYHPTVWKLTRVAGHFKPTSWQALPEGTDPTAAGIQPNGTIWFGHNNKVQTFTWGATSPLGSDKTLPVPADIVGLHFPAANFVFVTTATPNTASNRTTATSDSTIHRFDISGSTWTENLAWKFPLAGVGNALAGVDQAGMIDARDLAIIPSSGVGVPDKFYVSDGYDSRASGDHPIYVYTLASATTPTPTITATPSQGFGPLTVQFATAPSMTSPPSTFAWDFDGDGATDSTVQNPSHTFSAPGVYSVNLTVTNAAGPGSVTHTVVVHSPPHFETLNGNGTVTRDHFGAGNALLPYGGQFQSFYGDRSFKSLAHSWWDGARWNLETLDGAGRNTTDDVGANVTAMQYGAQIQLFYSDATTHTLRHAWWDGTRWNVETLDGAGGANGRTTHQVAGGTIAAFQFGAQVQLFYPDDTAHVLRHAWWDGSRWNFENRDATTLPASGTYVAARQFGSTVQVAYKTAAADLQHSWFDGAWHTEVLDGAGGANGRTSHAVGDSVTLVPNGGQLDVLYQDTTSSALRHAWMTGTTWTFETVDGAGGVATNATADHVGASIAALVYGGALHVVYQDVTTGAQRHAAYDGSWRAEVLDGTGSTWAGASTSNRTGLWNAMAIFGGQLHVSYFDGANGDSLRHSWFS
jgi:PKD repeat protein